MVDTKGPNLFIQKNYRLRIIISTMDRFFTGKGDDGYTGLLGEGRVPKYHPRPQAVGAIDEATAALGVARSAARAPQTDPLLLDVQRDLYKIMAEVSALPENASRFRTIDSARVAWLEEQTESIGSAVTMPNEFIVPGDSPAGAAMAVARTVVRRAERHLAELLHNGLIENSELLRYLNRLSSLCFVLELLENEAAGKGHSTLARGDPSP
jgi:cob(I)alamin adenosyltransferase